MPIIKRIFTRKIFDSRGVETLEVDVITENGFGRVAAPFGAPGSRGEFEAPAYSPEGLDTSIAIVEKEIQPKIVGLSSSDQGQIDGILKDIDGTENFERIGGNTSSTISLAVAKAAASALNVPLYKHLALDGSFRYPYPLGNMIGGGAHSMGSAPDMQEHLVVSIGARDVKEAIMLNLEVHGKIGDVLEGRDPGFAGGMDDERAWVANLTDVEAFDIIYDVCLKIKEKTGMTFGIGLDLAADRLWNPDTKEYEYHREGKSRTTNEQIGFLSSLIEKYNLVYVEDAFHSNDYASFAVLNEKYGHRCFICADDIYASNPERTGHGIELNSANAMILKPNQVGTVTGALETCKLAQKNKVRVIVSHRSGETDDASIAHLAIGWHLPMIKTGVLGGERLAKLNELLRVNVDYPMADLSF
ncbi:MAG: phosphopyruvate hydratase [Deltaproteobacteria bacterium]|nr:phosphopyruvate hydratase [Deltaproteobacteria bacterium]